MAKARIMLVEDEAITAEDIRATLEDMGYEVPAVAASGEEAIRLAAEFRPDLILMDIILDGPMNGIEAAQAIRQANAIPIVYLTSHTDTETVAKAKTTEPFGYLPKPCAINTTYSAIDVMRSAIEVALFKGEADAERRKAEAERERLIGELRQTQAELEATRARYFALYDLAPVGYLTVNEVGLILETNLRAAALLGERRDALARQPLARFIAPEDQDAYSCHCRQLMATGAPQACELRLMRCGSPFWARLEGTMTRNEENGAPLYLLTLSDISENRSLQDEVMKAKNLESLGILAGGIAHDFNNLFQGLLGNISLAKMLIPETSEAWHFLHKAEQAYTTATNLTSQLISFSSGCISLRVELPLSNFIRETVTSELRGSGLEVDFDLAEDLSLVNADPVQFRQVMKHLVLNAMEAMPPGGRLWVMAANEVLSPEAARATTLEAGRYVKVSIKDQGSGISEEDMHRIFYPYYSTKQRGAKKGMGLGLSLCDTVVKKHGGAITVESEVGKGATFHVYIPAFSDAAQKAAARVDKSTLSGPRILIMDDDALVVQVATEFLGHSGFRVDSTMDGEAAITAYQEAIEAGDPYAALILDLNIPGGKGGAEVIAVLKQLDPGVKAIVSSGYGGDPAMIDYQSHGFIAACVKPYQLSEIKALLDGLV